MNSKDGVHFIGLSIDELIEHGKNNLRELDELKVDSEVRDGYSKFIGSLHNQRKRMSSYFFVYSKFIVLKLEF